MAKRRAEAGVARRWPVVLAAVALGLVPARFGAAQTSTNIIPTKHNLSASGPGDYKASGESRICIFCHTPHNATASSPLWNKSIEALSYQVYASPTLKVAQKLGAVPQPTGPTKLCLSCHDGTIALGAVLNPPGGIAMGGTGTLPSSSLSNLGLDLRGHHPVSFSYADALPNAELASSPPPELTWGGADEVHCVTCHDPHDDRFGRFLLKDNRSSALCITCHRIPGWSASAHATSTASVAGILPRPPKDWPTWTRLGEWGCESCHTPHFAPTAEQLLLFTDTAPAFSCTASGCHGSAPGPPHAAAPAAPGPAVPRPVTGRADIGRQVRKSSAHHEPSGAVSSEGGQVVAASRSGVRSVACADCHNPHLVSAAPTEAPSVSGLLQGVPGVDRNGAIVRRARYEYEICFRCHGDNSGDVPYVVRVVPETNTRYAFDTNNLSYHPVVGMGRNLDVPSIPSSFSPAMRASQLLACTSCHADDEGGSRGPHGSAFPPILKERYEIADGTVESYEVYALCYRCHERTSILGDSSFRRRTVPKTPSGGGHSGHLRAGAACATCHDPHGVSRRAGVDLLRAMDGTHLVNFDVRTVSPLPGSPYPVYRSTGPFSGTCTLVCHGVTHSGMSYP